MNLLSTTEAAKQKGISRQAIIKAVGRGEIDGHKISNRSLVVIANKKFETWTPMAVRQQAGRARWSTSKKKGRKSA